MNVTIIGTGNMAKGIASRFLSGGHTVTLHAHDTAKGDEAAKALEKNGAVKVVPVGTPTDDAVVVLAVPHPAVADLAEQYENFAGKIVIDITNPVDFNTFELTTASDKSGAEAIAEMAPDANVLKAFNTIFAGTLMAGEVKGEQLDVLIAGDDKAAKQAVSELVNTSGMRAVDVGPLARARHLEGLALIHMSVQDQLQTSWMSTIKILG